MAEATPLRPNVAGELVWIQGLRHAYPEKWPIDATAGGKVGKIVLARHPLTPGEFGMPIAILEQRYPAPKAEP